MNLFGSWKQQRNKNERNESSLRKGGGDFANF